MQLRFESAPPNLEGGRIADAINSTDVPNNAVSAATVRFVPPAEMAHLNGRFKGGEGPTNVLTFVHGTCADIAICRQVAVTDARIRGWGLCSELAYLCIHGCLHALGFDHTDEEARNKMNSVERLVLAKMGIDTPAMEPIRD